MFARWWDLWSTLQPVTRGWSRCFGELSCRSSLFYSHWEELTSPLSSHTNICICVEAERYSIMYVYICLCVVWGDSQKCVDSVSFPAHVGGYPKLCSDQITLVCADSVYLHVHSCIYACVSDCMCTLIIICVFLCTTPHILGKDSDNSLLNKVFDLSHLRESVYFTNRPFTVFCSGSNYDGPPSHAHCRHSSETWPPHSGCLFHMFIFTVETHPSFHPSTSFRLLLSAAHSVAALMSRVRWG